MGMGIAGMISTTILAVKATPKAVQLLEEKKNDLEVETLPPVEVVKTTWKCYVPAAISCAASIACLIGSNSVNARRHAALATAYKLSESAFNEYRDSVVDVVGEKKEKTIRDKISEKQVNENPVTKTEIIMTGKGKTLFFDPLSSRYFYSDLELIRRVENKLNKAIIADAFDAGVTVNEFYQELGLATTATGDNLGWKIDNMIDIYPSACIAEEGTDHEGEPCIVINHYNPPKYDFL